MTSLREAYAFPLQFPGPRRDETPQIATARILLYLDRVYARATPITDVFRAPRALDNRLKVLVVDDDPEARELVATAVERFGHDCRIAIDGPDALRLLAEAPADVVISDWDMPGMTGAELCKNVASRAMPDDAPYTYFIMMTGLADREHLLAGMAAGADDYQTQASQARRARGPRLISAGRVVELHRRLQRRKSAQLRSIAHRRPHGDRQSPRSRRRATPRSSRARGATAADARSRFATSISSSSTTTRSVTLPATRPCVGWRRASARSCVTSTPSFVTAVRNSSSCLLEQGLSEAERVMERLRGEIEGFEIEAPSRCRHHERRRRGARFGAST